MIEFAYRTIGQFNLANHWIEFCTGTSAVGKKKLQYWAKALCTMQLKTSLKSYEIVIVMYNIENCFKMFEQFIWTEKGQNDF